MALACISFYSPDQLLYDCVDTTSQTSVTSSHTTTPSTATTMFLSKQTDQDSSISRSELNIIVKITIKMRFTHELMMCSKLKNHNWCWFSVVRSWTGVPFWYMLLRWGLFLALLMFLLIIIKCAESWSKRRKRRGRLDGIWRFHCGCHNSLMIDEKKRK